MSLDRTEHLDRELGARVRARRRELRMSQTRLGERLGVTFQQVQKYERGVNRISASALILISEALHCRPADLIGSDGSEQPIDWSRFQDTEVNAALEAFAAIESQKVRRAVLELMRMLSGREEANAPVPIAGSFEGARRQR